MQVNIWAMRFQSLGNTHIHPCRICLLIIIWHYSNFLDSLDGDVQAMYGNNNNNGSNNNSNSNNPQSAVTTPTVNTTEKFFLTAADPSDGKLEDRLTEVINAKYEAGFLKPYNYVNGYARLQKYMDNK